MIEIKWLSRTLIVATHEMILAQYGGPAGVRDENQLESAINKPKHLLVYGNRSITELAASHAVGIIKNHPFIDGNKRTGLMLAIGFLERNGCKFFAAEVDAVIQTLALAAGEIDETGYAKWLKENSRPKGK